jgi:hypothetical protein
MELWQSFGPWWMHEQLQQNGLTRGVALYLVPPSGAAVTFGATLVAAQAAGTAVGISCATHVLAPVVVHDENFICSNV